MEKLYYESDYVQEFEAEIIECFSQNGNFAIILDRTGFYPEGGGQPSDIGSIGNIEVYDVREKQGKILHFTKMPLEVGSIVNCKIDWKRRFSIMQGHTGEHIVSGIIKKLHGFDNVGFHMGSDFITIDINGMLTDDEINEVETLANKAIYENIAICSEFKHSDEIRELEFRSKKEFDGEVRIVTIHGYDTCACCGTHLHTTGEIGIIKIITYQKYKIGQRIFLLCGERALNDYAEKNRMSYELSSLLSSKVDSIVSSVKHLQSENSELRLNLNNAKRKLLSLAAEKIEASADDIYSFHEDLSSDELRYFSLLLSEKSKICAVFTTANEVIKYAIASKNSDVREITSELNSKFSGKGGGKAELTQGSLTSDIESLSAFLTLKGFKQSY